MCFVAFYIEITIWSYCNLLQLAIKMQVRTMQLIATCNDVATCVRWNLLQIVMKLQLIMSNIAATCTNFAICICSNVLPSAELLSIATQCEL